jgi:hypothetical protein
MFENVRSLRGSGGGTSAALRLESLEDRTTPAVVVAIPGPLSTITSTPSTLVDQQYLIEQTRLSLMQVFLGTVEATHGTSGLVQAFAQQVVAADTNALNQLVPALAAEGLTFQLSVFDAQVIATLPTLSGIAVDTQFLALSAMNTFQSTTLDRTQVAFGFNPAVRAFAQQQVSVAEQVLLSEVTLLGPAAASATLSLFNLLGGFTVTSAFGAPGTTGFGTIGLSATGGFGPGNTNGAGLTTSGPNAFGPTGGFGPTAPFGTSNGFGPQSTVGGGVSIGFGPGASFGGTSNGFGPQSTVGFTNGTMI